MNANSVRGSAIEMIAGSENVGQVMTGWVSSTVMGTARSAPVATLITMAVARTEATAQVGAINRITKYAATMAPTSTGVVPRAAMARRANGSMMAAFRAAIRCRGRRPSAPTSGLIMPTAATSTAETRKAPTASENMKPAMAVTRNAMPGVDHVLSSGIRQR